MDSQYLPTLMIISIVMIGFLASGIFSDEFHYKADSIFFSAALGRDKAVRAKMKASFLTVTVIYWSAMLLFSLIVLAILGFDGGSCMIQTGFSNWDSFYNITYVQKWLLSLAGGYIAHLFILTFAMLISAKSRSTALAVTIPFILSCVPMFLGRIPILTEFIKFFPDALLRISAYIDDFLLVEIGENVFGLYCALMPFYLILSLALMLLLYWIFKKTEIKS